MNIFLFKIVFPLRKFLKQHLYRSVWFMVASMSPRRAIFLFAVCLFLTPFVMATASSHHFSNTAMAAIGHGYLDGMPAGDRLRYARAIHGKLDRNPEALLKLSGFDVRLAFVKPDLVRSDGDIEVWQFRTGDCVLDIFVSEDGKRNDVIHYEMRTRDKAMLSSQEGDAQKSFDLGACMQNILAQSLPGKGVTLASLFTR